MRLLDAARMLTRSHVGTPALQIDVLQRRYEVSSVLLNWLPSAENWTAEVWARSMSECTDVGVRAEPYGQIHSR